MQWQTVEQIHTSTTLHTLITDQPDPQEAFGDPSTCRHEEIRIKLPALPVMKPALPSQIPEFLEAATLLR